jgi:hypothetical protein
LNSKELVELALDSTNISLGKWTLTLSSKDDLHSIANKLPKYFHRLYRYYKVSPSCKEVLERVEYTTHPHIGYMRGRSTSKWQDTIASKQKED